MSKLQADTTGLNSAAGSTTPPTAPGEEQALSLQQRLTAERAGAVRRPPAVNFGAIDVGTNSIHLVMAEISPEGDFRILGRDKDMVQLGKGGFVQHVLTARAIDDGIQALKRFSKMARLKGITRLKAVATSAVREARNGGDFVNRVREAVGLELQVISPEEEARLTYLAVRHAMDLGTDDNLILDIGGGSVELIVGNSQRPEILDSVKLGASRLTEMFMKNDPPTEADLKTLRHYIEKHIEPLLKRIGKRTFARCIGTSGTVRSLATLCAQRRGLTEVNDATQLAINKSELKSLLTELQPMTREQRHKIPGMDSRRADMALPSVMLLMSVLRALDLDEVRYCDMALREGVILNHIARNRDRLMARSTWPDPRTRSVIQLAERCAYPKEHADQVARLGLSLFDQLADLHRLNTEYRELFRFACLLHDIGYLIGHLGHHKHAYYLIRNGELKGFSDQEIEIIANVARYHRKDRPKKSHYSYQHLNREHRRPVRRLATLLRLANALDRTHYSVVDHLICRVLPNRIEVRVHAVHDVELELWTARRLNDQFEKEFRMPLAVLTAGIEGAESTHE